MPVPETLLDLIEHGRALNRAGVQAATKRDGRWREMAADVFAQHVRDAALGLYALGVRPGDRVALHAENSAEWLVVDQAVLSLGAVLVPIYTTQPGDQIRYILANAGAVVYVVSTPKLYAAFEPYRDAVPTLKARVGLFGAHDEGMTDLSELLGRGREQDRRTPELFAELRGAVAPDALATLIYTSGTTGQPKGVMLTHRNIVANVLASRERVPFDLETGDERVLSYLPLAHAFERMLSYLYQYLGLPIYFVEDHMEMMEDLQTVRPIHFSTVPRLLEKIYAGIAQKVSEASGVQGRIGRWAIGLAEAYDPAHPPTGLQAVQHRLADALVFRKLRQRLGGRLVGITSGGAALSGRVMSFINALGVFCGQGYGLTETSPVISVYERGEAVPGSAGVPLSNLEVRIADDGEILVRGPSVMQGYFGMPEQTAEVLEDDGWFHTGDIGELRGGHLYITDRKKSLMKLSTGKYVATQPIETGLGASRFVEHAMALGNDRKFCAALVVPDRAATEAVLRAEGVVPGENDWCAHPRVRELVQQEIDALNQTLPAWERVKRFALVCEPFSVEGGELTPTLKLRRRVIMQKYEELIEHLYAAPQLQA